MPNGTMPRNGDWMKTMMVAMIVGGGAGVGGSKAFSGNLPIELMELRLEMKDLSSQLVELRADFRELLHKIS